MAITKRTGLGRPLTHEEMDANFEELRAERAGTATTGSNTYNNDQFISGSVKVSHTISGSSLNVSDDIYLGDKIYDRTDTNQYVDFGGGSLTFFSNGKMLEIKSGSGITFGASTTNHSFKIYATDTVNYLETGSVEIYGTTHLSGSQYTGSAGHGLTAITVTGSIIPEGSGSHDLGTLENPFRDLYISSASLVLVDTKELARVKALGPEHVVASASFFRTKFTKDKLDTLEKGESIKSKDDLGIKLATPRLQTKAKGTSAYPGIVDITPIGNVGIHSTATVSASKFETDTWEINGGYFSGSDTSSGSMGHLIVNDEVTVGGGLGITIGGGSGFIRTNPYGGNNPLTTPTNAGFLMWSGSGTHGTSYTYNGIGFEFVNSSGSFIRWQDTGSFSASLNSLLEVGGDVKVSGDITARSASFDHIVTNQSSVAETNYSASVFSGSILVSGSTPGFDATINAVGDISASDNIYIRHQKKLSLSEDPQVFVRLGTGGIGLEANTGDVIAINEGGQNVNFTYDNEGGTLVHFDGEDDRVGIGTQTPTTMLDVRGHISSSHNILAAGNILAKSATFSGTTLVGNSTDDTFRVSDGAGTGTMAYREGSIRIFPSTVNPSTNGILTVSSSGGELTQHARVGIGTENPTHTLTVDGNVSASSYVGDGSGLTGVTAEWDGTHTGNGNISGVLTTQAVSASGIISASTGISSSGHISTKFYGDTLVRLHNSYDDGIVSVYQNNIEKIKLSGVDGSISASGNIQAARFYGDGANLSNVTAEWDGTHTGNGVFIGNVSASAISASTFEGDGSGLTGITAEWDGTRTGTGNISGVLTAGGLEVSSSGFSVSTTQNSMSLKYIINESRDLNGTTYPALHLSSSNDIFVGGTSVMPIVYDNPTQVLFTNAISSSAGITAISAYNGARGGITLKDGSGYSYTGDTLIRLYGRSDDGVIDIYRNNSVSTKIHGNGESYFNAGNVGIGKENPTVTLDVSGSVSASNVFSEKIIVGSAGTTTNANAIVTVEGNISSSGNISADNGLFMGPTIYALQAETASTALWQSTSGSAWRKRFTSIENTTASLVSDVSALQTASQSLSNKTQYMTTDNSVSRFTGDLSASGDLIMQNDIKLRNNKALKGTENGTSAERNMVRMGTDNTVTLGNTTLATLINGAYISASGVITASAFKGGGFILDSGSFTGGNYESNVYDAQWGSANKEHRFEGHISSSGHLSVQSASIGGNVKSTRQFFGGGAHGWGDDIQNTLTIWHRGVQENDGIQFILSPSWGTGVSYGDMLGGIGFDSNDGFPPPSVLSSSAYIAAFASEAHGSGDKGGYLSLGISKENDDYFDGSHEIVRVGQRYRSGYINYPAVTIKGDLVVSASAIVSASDLHIRSTYNEFVSASDGNISASNTIHGADGISSGQTASGSFGALTLRAPNGSLWTFSTNNDGHLQVTGSQA